jgi:hypothetical protein
MHNGQQPMSRRVFLQQVGAGVAGAALASALPERIEAQPPQPKIVDYTDPMYGGKVRQLLKPDGHEHNLYYCRNPWNADSRYLLVVYSDMEQKNWRVALHEGDGRFLKELFTIDRYDWRLVWDRKNPEILYTWKEASLYRYNVNTGNAELLKSFAPLGFKPAGPSLNQAGDRILVITSDGTFHSYRLPDMQDERTFKASIPSGCFVSWDKPSYTGTLNHIHVAYRSSDFTTQAILIYDDTGALVHRFEGTGGGGHYDFSPDGKLAYFKMPRGRRQGGGSPLEIHVVKIDGTDDRVLYSVPQSKATYVQNLHLSWADKVSDWFVASFFPSAQNLPAVYAPPLDEIMLVKMDGTHKCLARTGTTYSREGARGRAGDMFWAQPLASPSSDGKRISFNSNRSGTIDQCILFVGQ